jgi:hypothetical protein
LRNVDIRSELGDTNIVEETEHYRKKWKEHILRMPRPRFPQQVLFIDNWSKILGVTMQKVDRTILSLEQVV